MTNPLSQNKLKQELLYAISDHDVKQAIALASQIEDFQGMKVNPLWLANDYGLDEIAKHLFNQAPAYFSEQIKKDDRLSACPNLVAMMDHYKLTQAGEDIRHDGYVVKSSKRVKLKILGM